MFIPYIRSFAVAGLALGALTSFLPAQAQQESPLVCPVFGTSLLSPEQAFASRDVRGVRYYLCCQPCVERFDKEPSRFAVAPSNKAKANGVFLFDPVTTRRLDADKVVAYSVYDGVYYPFATAQDKTAFDKDPKKYATRPEKELLYCPVSDRAVKSYAAASDYSDYKGERIYMCCPGCKAPFEKEPARYADRIEAFRKKQAASTNAGGAVPEKP